MTSPYERLATLSNVIRTAFRSFIKEVHTSLPGIVESFDPNTQTASVQPAIKRVYKVDGVTELKPIGVCINVPVTFPRGGGYSLTFPVSPGDECLLQFTERSYDLWRRTGKVEPPGAFRQHSLSDAVAIMGFNSEPNLIPNYNAAAVELKSDNGNSILEIGDGTVTLSASINFIVNGNMQLNGNLTQDGAQDVTGDVVAAGVSLATHVHPYTDDGAPLQTGAPVGT